MYTPAYNKITELTEIKKLIRENAFATLITVADGLPNVSHIPIELVEEGDTFLLEGHLSRANPHGEDFEKNVSALAIFRGPHAYVSSSWYGHINAPTWNYIVVHITGKITVMDETQLHASLKKLTEHFEMHSEKPFRIESMPDDMLKKYLKGIIGFRMSVEKIEGKWKMSQNRNDEDYQNIIKELEKLDDVNSKLVADVMKKLK